MPNILFTNLMGGFVFDEKFKLVDYILIDQNRDILKFRSALDEIMKKYEAHEASDLESSFVITEFTDIKYRKHLVEKNLSITRKSIKNSVSEDTLIVHAISSIEDLDKITNLLSKRLREWNYIYNPEISHAISDNEKFSNTISSKSREQLLNDLNIDEDMSLGSKLKKNDISAILSLSQQLTNLFKLRKHYEKYIITLEMEICPNLLEVAGSQIAAKLLRHTGTLKRLARMPASTIQILGAERALFRHLRNKRKNLMPKHGLIHEHPLILKSKLKQHAKAARALADKISIAVKVDFFKGKPIGKKLKNDLVSKFSIDY
jgi:nucleolar protein 56